MKNVKFQGKSYTGYDAVIVTENGVQCPKCADARNQRLEWSILQHALFPEMENCTYLAICDACEHRYGFSMNINSEKSDSELSEMEVIG